MTYSPGWTYKSASVTAAQAFEDFRRHKVDLISSKVKKARQSRVYLQEQLTAAKNDDPDFPRIADSFMPFGSFARKTKVRPLDDVDLLVMLNGLDSQVKEDVLDTSGVCADHQ